ncbi:MAG: hypothetical protein ACOC93_02390, partial [Planctomycetota bacterium]
MTTLANYPGMEELIRRIAAVRSRRRAVRLVAGGLTTVAVTLSAVLVLAVGLGYWADQPPVLLRWALVLSAAAGVLGTAGWCVAGVLLRRENLAQTAREIEQALPEVRNDLINSLLLARDGQSAGRPFIQRAIREAAQRSKQADFQRSISLQPLRRRAMAAGLAALAVLVFALLQPGAMQRGLRAAVSPAAFVPYANEIELVELTPGDTTCFAGSQVEIVARIENPGREELAGEVWLAGTDAPQPMRASGGGTVFRLPPRRAEESFRYCVRIGENRWPADRPYYTVKVIRRIGVESLDLEYDYPHYTGLKNKTLRGAPGPIRAPVGSRVKVRLHVDSALPAAVLQRAPGGRQRMKTGLESKEFWLNLPVREDGRYRLLLTDEQGRTLQRIPEAGASGSPPATSADGKLMSGAFPIEAIPDQPPQVEFHSPGRDVTQAAGSELPLRLRVSDDYGLSKVSLFLGAEGEPAERVHAFDLAALKGGKRGVLHTTLKLEGYQEGDVLVYYAEATDNRNLPGVDGPQTRQSDRFRIVLEDPSKLAAEKTERIQRLRELLLSILEAQVHERTRTAICRSKHETLEQIQTTGGAIQAGQDRIRARLVDLVETFPFDAETRTVQQACALLANNEAPLAVDQAQLLAALAEMNRREAATSALAGTQEKIIQALQTLLAWLPTANRKPREKSSAQGEDLPPEAAEKYRRLQEKMEEFIDAQQKAIEAGERLTKAPLDDFGNDKLRKELQATQDKWEKFLNEAIADFSKLAEQDFSNPAMLEELISVKCDVTMATDALQAEADEIATAAEDSGAENAKSLTANIEKWLPDTPDRTKWAMEAPEDQQNVEMPELPTELEDLVGDLLEQEE